MNTTEKIKRLAQRVAILRLIERRPVTGYTCDEVEQRLNMIHQTASARIAELQQQGDLLESGRLRPTRTGYTARVMLPAKQCGVGRPRKAA